MLPHPRPPLRDHRRGGQPPTMSFRWIACDRHWFLGVSTLVVGDATTGTCFPEGGRPHLVELAELGVAA